MTDRDGSLDYDEENHALIFTERLGPDEMGAAAIVGHGVPPWIGHRIRLGAGLPDVETLAVIFDLARETLQSHDDYAKRGWAMTDIPHEAKVRAALEGSATLPSDRPTGADLAAMSEDDLRAFASEPSDRGRTG